MEEYTWDDIIINPNSEQAKACIGKEVYCADSPHYCLEKANGNEVDHTVYILQSIIPDNNYPFRLGKNAEYEHCCIIPKKEESKAYIPFSSVDEFLSTYFEKCESTKQKVNAHNENILCNHGIWIKDKTTGYISMVVELRENGVSRECGVLETINKGKSSYYPYTKVIKWANLLEDYNFLDNSPCGKKL